MNLPIKVIDGRYFGELIQNDEYMYAWILVRLVNEVWQK